jgi:O-antigen ligase
VRALQIGIFALVTFAVAVHGVVEVWSESAFEIGAALLFLGWGIVAVRSSSAKIYWSDLNWPIAAFFAWVILQLFFRITVYPYLTWIALLRWGACFLIFFVATQVFRERGDLQMLTWFFVLLAFCVALEGIIQYFTGTEKIYGLRELQLGGGPFGPFVNRNHFAGLMELLTPVGLAFLAFRGVRRDLIPLVGLFTLVPVAAIFLAASRGGLISFAVQLALLAFIYISRSTGKMRPGLAIAFLVALALLVSWMGVTRVFHRFATKGTSEVTMQRRLTMTKGTLRVFLAHPITGTGLGTLVVVFPRFDTDYDGKLVDHAHNEYAEILAELGLPGAICGLAFLWILLRAGARGLTTNQGHFSTAYHVAALVACVGILVHSFVDFNLHIPSNAVVFLLQAGVLLTPPLLPDPSTKRKHRVSRFNSNVDIRTSGGS